jgi:hypothetical protein
VLTLDDLRSQTFARLKEHFERRRQALLAQLEKDSSPEVTAKLRGRVAEIKELLALDAPARAPDPALAALGIEAAGPNTPEPDQWSSSS